MYSAVAAAGERSAGDAVDPNLNAESAVVAFAADISVAATAADAAVPAAAAKAIAAVVAVVVAATPIVVLVAATAAAVVVVVAASAIAAVAVVAASAIAAVAVVAASATAAMMMVATSAATVTIIVVGAADIAHGDNRASCHNGAHAVVVPGNFKLEGNPVVSAQASHLFAAIAARQVEMQATVDAIPGVVHGDDIGAIVPTNGKTRAFGATQNLIDLLTAQYPTLILTHKKSHPFGVN